MCSDTESHKLMCSVIQAEEQVCPEYTDYKVNLRSLQLVLDWSHSLC